MERGADGFLVTISMGKDNGQHELHDFFEALKGLPPARGYVLTIELEPWAAPVSRASYRLTPAEMAVLKR